MPRHPLILRAFPALLALLSSLPAGAQSFRVQCPTSTITHPSSLPNGTPRNNSSEPEYAGPTTFVAGANGYLTPSANVNGAIKCQQISGGDGYATMGDGTQTYLFAFGPLSGLADIANGLPGTGFPNAFNAGVSPSPVAGDPATTVNAGQPFAANGAVGLAPEVLKVASIQAALENGFTATIVLDQPVPFNVGETVIISGMEDATAPEGAPPDYVPAAGYNGTWTVTAIGVPNPYRDPGFAFQYTNTISGLPEAVRDEPDLTPPLTDLDGHPTAATPPVMTGHVDPRQIMDVGVMNGNFPAPLMAIDEDDEFFLTLSNVGMIMRPDLFEQHTVHFHGYPNASAFYDGVPDASVAIQIGGSFTYYYLAPEAGTYFWHCHITPPEHLQMGMVGQLYVRPRQNRVRAGNSLFSSLQAQQSDPRTACNSAIDILCSNPLPAANTTPRAPSGNYAYNDGDGSTYYDVEYPLQIHGFDPNFHFVGMTFNPEGFADMKDKYFLLNGRSYPDTVTAGPLQTPSADGVNHFSQPLTSIINIPAGKKALLRISSLDVSEYQTLASLGIPMKVIGYNAKLLRDQAGNNLYYTTNSITLGGGESLDVILDASDQAKYPKGSVFYLYTPNLDHLSNDAENFGGLMTEVRIN